MRALLDETLRDVKDPVQGALTAMLKAATMVYSDPAHPENLMCYLPNKKQDSALVHVQAVLS